MKRIALLFLTVAALAFSAEGGRIPADAYAKGALAQVRIKVVDQEGYVVSGARIWGGFTCGSRMKDFILVDGVSNANGEYIAQGRCNEFLRFDVRKDGYYHTEEKIFFGRSKASPIIVDGKWQPYGEMRTVVLKKIKNLGRLSVPNVGLPTVRERKIPKLDCWIPFDLEKFDWNAPYGAGVHPDVLVRFRSRTTPYYYDYTHWMDICFTNNPFAGVYELKKDKSSDMKTVYEADPNMVYKSSVTFVCERTNDGKRTADYLKDDAYLVFRTRTSVDRQGRLKSAHYGSILGGWMSGTDSMRFYDGCFNPIENDCNLEDGYYLREAVKHYQSP